jgi:hypothetical protein
MTQDGKRGLWLRRKDRGPGTATPAPPSLEELRRLMAYEFNRARRYDRPLAIISLTGAPTERVPSLLRLYDVICSARDGKLVVLLPETNATGVLGLVNRLKEELGVGVAIGSACFPEDALTLEDLVACAMRGTSAKRAERAIR